METRVLVVDDDADVRDSLRRALGYAGYEVATAVNGAEALKSVAKSPVDLIILDVLMPMLDGLGACRALRDRGDGTPAGGRRPGLSTSGLPILVKCAAHRAVMLVVPAAASVSGRNPPDTRRGANGPGSRPRPRPAGP